MDLKELKAELDTMKAGLEVAITENAKAEITEQLKEIKSQVEAIEAKAAKANETEVEALKAEVAELKYTNNSLTGGLEILAKRVKNIGRTVAEPQKKDFDSAFSEVMAEQFESKKSDFEAFKKDKNAKVSFELDLKTVGNMLLSSNLTGDGVASYNSRQGIVPSQKINFRDLIPTQSSPTGLYVTYREGASEGSISAQTEGSGKTQIDYDLTEVKVVSDYIAGYARFSKQMMYQLPFLQGTLQRMLIRDFYKVENSTFFTAVSGAATGSTTTTATVDAEQLIQLIANERTANFDASFILVSHTEWARLLMTKPNDYSIPGGVVFDSVGNMRIAGVPVVPASWVTDDKALIIDRDFVERVETESMRVEFSYEDADNFTKNLVTARIECFEDINLLRLDAHIYADLGNVS